MDLIFLLIDNMEKLRDAKDVYLSANLGIPAIRNYHSGDAINSFWEWGVVVLTVLFFLKAKAINLTNVTLHIKPLGAHNYWVAAQELRETKERILNKTIDDDDDGDAFLDEKSSDAGVANSRDDTGRSAGSTNSTTVKPTASAANTKRTAPAESTSSNKKPASSTMTEKSVPSSSVKKAAVSGTSVATFGATS